MPDLSPRRGRWSDAANGWAWAIVALIVLWMTYEVLSERAVTVLQTQAEALAGTETVFLVREAGKPHKLELEPVAGEARLRVRVMAPDGSEAVYLEENTTHAGERSLSFVPEANGKYRLLMEPLSAAAGVPPPAKASLEVESAEPGVKTQDPERDLVLAQNRPDAVPVAGKPIKFKVAIYAKDPSKLALNGGHK